MAAQKNIQIVNRKAKFEYHFIQEFEAGIQLQGTEVKSIRAGDANLNDAYCVIRNGEVFIISLYIAIYKYGNINNHETRRERKLLLKKNEINKLDKRVTEKGMSVVPYKILISDRGFVKVMIALAEGKKSYDKRDSIKQRENKIELDRMKKIRL